MARKKNVTLIDNQLDVFMFLDRKAGMLALSPKGKPPTVMITDEEMAALALFLVRKDVQALLHYIVSDYFKKQGPDLRAIMTGVEKILPLPPLPADQWEPLLQNRTEPAA